MKVSQPRGRCYPEGTNQPLATMLGRRLLSEVIDSVWEAEPGHRERIPAHRQLRRYGMTKQEAFGN